MTTFSQHEVLSELDLQPSDVPGLPAKARSSLVAYLLRWRHYGAARRCLQQLLATHSRTVSVYDNLARAYLGLEQPEQARVMMQRRHALQASNSSRALEARVHLAAGDLSSAQAISEQLLAEQPEMLLAWSLQAEIRQAAGDLDGAEAALRQRESLRPGASGTALGLARVRQARGNDDQALLWAQTALARVKRDERLPSVDLLRLLESLYRATGQPAQARAIADELAQREREELQALEQLLAGEPVEEVLPTAETSPLSLQPQPSPSEPVPSSFSTGPVTGAVELTPEEQTRLDQTLRQHFEHKSFRQGQADVIATILRGQSALAVMPTGSGKSLCYQLAALLLPGTTLVISPLIALMKDQLDGLPAGVARQATTLNSTLDGAELESRLARAAAGGYKMLYAAPERLRQRPFLHAIKKAGVSLMVVDEAHCVSLWGHDFRPDYLFIEKAWHELDRPPILALTATATPRVRDDIQTALGNTALIATDIHRPNLFLEAYNMANDAARKRALLDTCRQIEGSGIVYARSRAKCEELAAMLRAHGQAAIHYHAGVADRAAAQDRFMRDEARIVVATIAFGMGVDKADVRFVVHYHPPKTLENYYQEAGRAGRDGLPARCILFHSASDKALMTRWARQDNLRVAFLRDTYAAIQRRLGVDRLGLVTVGDLERDLVADATDIRVAVHFLETAGLVWRGFDLPRTARLTLCRPVDDQDPILTRFVAAGRLQPGQTVSRDLIALSREARLDPRNVEDQVLAWEAEGWLRYRGIGRDMLLALPEPPTDSRENVAAMLAAYHDGQDGRIADMLAYAGARRCRHGYISDYFGGRSIERCQACDNCRSGSTAQRPQPRPARRKKRVSAPPSYDGPSDPTTIVLEGVTQLPYPLGRTGLARALQGAASSSIQADRFSLFGALSGWTQKRIREFIEQIENRDLLEHFEKSGYRLLQLSPEGQAWLERQPPPESPASNPEAATAPSEEELPDEYDEGLFERLRAWRLETAQANEVPPYVVFHNTVLQRIAAARPATEDELLAIKGIGPRKLEQYGEVVLQIVADRREEI